MYQRNHRFGAIVATVGHRFSSYCWLAILHVFPEGVFSIWFTLLLFIVSMVLSCRFGFESWFVYSDLWGKCWRWRVKTTNSNIVWPARWLSAFPAWRCGFCVMGGLKRLQANQAMKLGKWTKILGVWGWENLNIPLIYVYLYSVWQYIQWYFQIYAQKNQMHQICGAWGHHPEDNKKQLRELWPPEILATGTLKYYQNFANGCFIFV